jgi:hypothetical protein
MPNKPQYQGSLQCQLNELYALANKEGLYDAADFIRNAMTRKVPCRYYLEYDVGDDGGREWMGPYFSYQEADRELNRDCRRKEPRYRNVTIIGRPS